MLFKLCPLPLTHTSEMAFSLFHLCKLFPLFKKCFLISQFHILYPPINFLSTFIDFKFINIYSISVVVQVKNILIWKYFLNKYVLLGSISNAIHMTSKSYCFTMFKMKMVIVFTYRFAVHIYEGNASLGFNQVHNECLRTVLWWWLISIIALVESMPLTGIWYLNNVMFCIIM